MPSKSDDDFAAPYVKYLRDAAPGYHEAQSAWLAELESLRAPSRTTHELIRMACNVILGNLAGVERHAMLAAEVGATWEDITGAVLLTSPSFGISRAIDAMPHARKGYEAGVSIETETD